MQKIFNYQNIDFHFAHSTRDFVLSEIPLYDFSGSGEHQIVQLRKKGLSTFELIKILSAHFACPAKEIGYAGLKDKNATTTQFLSIPKIYFKHKSVESAFKELAQKHEIKLISATLHGNKLKLGHLKGNRFFVRLKKVTPLNAKKIESNLRLMQTQGFANFFGFQRFGANGENYKLGFALDNKTSGKRDFGQNFGQDFRQNFVGDFLGFANDFASHKIPKSKKMRNFLRSSLQSFLFNEWLCVRLSLGRFGEFGFGDFANAIKIIAKDFDKVDFAQSSNDFGAKSKLESSRDSSAQAQAELKSSTLDFSFLQRKAFANLANLPTQNLREIYQSLQIQKMPFKLLDGEICCHYPHGRFFALEGAKSSEIARFEAGEFAPTGALNGENLKTAKNIAYLLESPFLELHTKSSGARRYAWVWASECECSYKESEAQMELHFSLPSGAYATTLLEQIAGKELQ